MAEGTLTVSFEGDSYFLSERLPLEVRDHNDVLVERTEGRFHRALPAGLYRLRALLPDGSGHEEVVMIGPNQAVKRVFEARRTPPPARAQSFSESAPEELWDTSPGDDASAPVELIERYGAEVMHGRRFFAFVPGEPLEDTPYAVFSIGENRVSASLPVNPRGRYPGNACVVGAVATGRRDKLVTRFAMQRSVASAVEGLLRSNRFLSGSDLLDEATELLQGKYQDPPAAALGGLTLHRLGRLGDRRRWVENLARDFSWLPDGRVLLAAVLGWEKDPDDRRRGLEVLLEASRHRMMFTDGLALLLDLLRRWPDGEGENARGDALIKALPDVAGVDWDATFLTVYPVSPRDASE